MTFQFESIFGCITCKFTWVEFWEWFEALEATFSSLLLYEASLIYLTLLEREETHPRHNTAQPKATRLDTTQSSTAPSLTPFFPPPLNLCAGGDQHAHDEPEDEPEEAPPPSQRQSVSLPPGCPRTHRG